MKTFLKLAAIAALCLPAFAQGPNTILIGSEGITVTATSSPTAVFLFGAGTTWNTITAARFPLLISCTSACPQLGGDPIYGVAKSLYAVKQATAYTVTYSINGVTQPPKTIPALSLLYNLNCTGTGTISGTTLTSSNVTCTGTLVKQ